MDRKELEHRRELCRMKMASWMKMVGGCGNIVPARDDFGFSMDFGDSRCTLTVNPNTGCLDYQEELLTMPRYRA